MSPNYFAISLSLHEAKRYIAGVARRYHAGWEQARLISYYAAAPHCKKLDINKIARFRWEEAPTEEPPTEETYEELLIKARKIEKQLNGQNSRDSSKALT